MTRLAKFLRVVVSVAVIFLAVVVVARQSNIGAPVTLSKISKILIVVGGLGSALLVFLLSKSRGTTALASKHGVLKKVAAAALLGAAGFFVVTSALLPDFRSAATDTLPGGWIVHISEGTWRCGNQLRIETGSERRYVCACYRGSCMRGFSKELAVGQRVDLEVSTNWAGERVVGLVLNGA